MNALTTLEPLTLIYCMDGNIMFASSIEKPNNSKHRIDQKCKERVLLSNGKKPLLYINWLITPKCNYDCLYCYAKDIMQCTKQPDKDIISTTAQSILKFEPVVVALSGGEPFLSPHLEDIIKYLEGKTRTIIDTNGSVINHSLLHTIKEKDVLLRVSLDDINDRRNTVTRRNTFGGTNQTIKFILQCIKIGIDIVVQTVVTSVNYPYLQETKKYLQELGVKYWRLLPVSSLDQQTIPLCCSSQEIRNLRETLCQCRDMEITVQEEYEKERAGIVLVSPEGTFLTVNNEGKKVSIDPANPCSPDIDIFNEAIDWDAHMLRYIQEDLN